MPALFQLDSLQNWPRWLLAAALICLLATPVTARSPEPDPPGMRRCVSADGVAVFSDRRCEGQGATPALPRAEPIGATSLGPRVRTCARNQDDLLQGVRNALEARDPNRLADYYHWSGMSTAEGYRLMGRLESFSGRPLLDLELVSSLPARTSEPEWRERSRGRSSGLLSRPAWLNDEEAFAEPDDPIEQAPSRPADLLRVDQLRGDNDTDFQVTYLHLRSKAGCWWMQF